LRAALGDVPLLAEDLGIITPDVDEVRRSLGYPGMKVLQFAFSTDARNDNLPHHFERSCAVYTGTHDNDTALGWFDGLSPTEQTWTLRYLHATGADLHWDLIRLAFASVATLAVIPLQDVLGLGSEARMNLPGRTDGNWTWRFADGDIQIDHTTRLRDVAQTYGRLA
jgi:4-alpha-glucanotransferase